MSSGLNIQIEHDQGVSLVRIKGRLDAASASLLERKLMEQIEAGKIKLVVDFAKVDYLSSAGMRLLLSTTKKLKSGARPATVNRDIGALKSLMSKAIEWDVLKLTLAGPVEREAGMIHSVLKSGWEPVQINS